MESGRISRGSSNTNPNRIRLQAREAAVDYRDDNSDLIDFIRRGPPNTQGGPRIPRTVAPFRTTMDSDQMAAAVGGLAIDAQLHDIDVRSSQASTHVSSLHSSINSQSALLSSSVRNNNRPPASSSGGYGSNSGNAQFGGGGGDDMPMPQRKTRRVRDPYAIDLSDEDEDEDELDDLLGDARRTTPRAAPPAKRARPQTQEESLMDFLRNVPPPPEPVVVPFTETRQGKQMKKRSSATGLIAKFTKRDSGRHAASTGNGAAPRSPPSSRDAARSQLGSRSSNGGGAGRGYTPLVVSMPPGTGTGAAQNGAKLASMGIGVTSSVSPGRAVNRRFEARDTAAASGPVSAVGGQRATSDLAAFLKNSEPAVGMMDGPVVPSQSFGEGGNASADGFGSKMGWKRKKAGVA